MKTISGLLTMLIFTSLGSQVKNARTESLLVGGNCSMCKEKIEKAGTIRSVSKTTWDKENQRAVIVYNSKRITADAIAEKIAWAGFDNDKYLAPDAAYNDLPACCKYERIYKHTAVLHAMMADTTKPVTADKNTGAVNPLQAVFDDYFLLKDALVNANPADAAAAAQKLYDAVAGVKMESLTLETHMQWMKEMDDLKTHAHHITEAKTNLPHQREHFAQLSALMYQLMKVSKPDKPVYVDHCPMYNNGKGADWLSKDSVIRNPFYGSAMLSCGSTKEIIH